MLLKMFTPSFRFFPDEGRLVEIYRENYSCVIFQSSRFPRLYPPQLFAILPFSTFYTPTFLFAVSSGWGMFATSAAKFASVAKDNAVKYGSKAVETVNENVVKPTATRVKDGERRQV